MLGNLYDRALTGERCWIRYDDGSIHGLPVHNWLGGRRADRVFDQAVLGLCSGPTIDLGCGPGRFVVDRVRRGVPALGIDQSATAIDLARRNGAPALRRDVFSPLPGMGRWNTVLLADGNVGLGGDPRRVLRRAGELMRAGGRCVAEFDNEITGVELPVGAAGVQEDGRPVVQMGHRRDRLRQASCRRCRLGDLGGPSDRRARRG